MSTPLPQARFFEQRSEFQATLLEAIGCAETELLMFDPTYADWRINAPEFEEALIAFFGRSTRAALRMVITEAERLNRDYPRLVRVLRQYAHRADCRVTPEIHANLNETMLIVDRASALRRPITTRNNGVWRVLDPEYANAQHDRFEELWEACHERFSPTTLGL